MADEQAPTIEVPTPDAPDAAAVQAELEKTRIALKAANKEAAERRKRLEDLESAEQARKTAEMTETDRLKAELEAAKADVAKADARAKDMLIRSAFVAEAAKAGASYPEDVYRLADLSAVDVDDTGKINGVAEAVKALVDAGRVPLSGKQQAPNLDGGAGGGDRGHGSVKLTADELAMAHRMNITPEKYAANKAAMAAEET